MVPPMRRGGPRTGRQGMERGTPLADLSRVERAVRRGEYRAPDLRARQSSRWQSIRREIADEGLGFTLVFYLVFFPVFFVCVWAVRIAWLPLSFVYRWINERIIRFGKSHRIARRFGSYFHRHRWQEAAVGLLFLLPLPFVFVAFLVTRWHALFPGVHGQDLGQDFGFAWMMVAIGAAVLAIDLLGVLPFADLFTSPVEEIDLGTIFLTFFYVFALPLVAALFVFGVL
jgi:hypothetical protein